MIVSTKRASTTLMDVTVEDGGDEGDADVVTEKVASTSFVTVSELSNMCRVLGFMASALLIRNCYESFVILSILTYSTSLRTTQRFYES